MLDGDDFVRVYEPLLLQFYDPMYQEQLIQASNQMKNQKRQEYIEKLKESIKEKNIKKLEDIKAQLQIYYQLKDLHKQEPKQFKQEIQKF